MGPVEVSLEDLRKEITIEMYNEAGQLVLVYNVFRCRVSEYQAVPDLDASANAVAIQTLKLENEGWERDLRSFSLATSRVHAARLASRPAERPLSHQGLAGRWKLFWHF